MLNSYIIIYHIYYIRIRLMSNINVIVGLQNAIDLSWNNPQNNGYNINNYFFYVQDRTNITKPISSYYSYALPKPTVSGFLSSTADSLGFDINYASYLSTNVYSLLLDKRPGNTGTYNFFDLTHGGEIEISWYYHEDNPIIDICANTGTNTTITLNIYKQDSDGKNVVLIAGPITRDYNSDKNKLGPLPINNYPYIIRDIFSINSDISNVFLKQSDNISVNVSFSTLNYLTSTSKTKNDTKNFSIIMSEFKIAPYRLPITQRFTSLSNWDGSANGFLLNKTVALSPLGGNDTSGCLYYLPKLTNALKTYEKAKCSLSWSYDFDLSMSAADLSFCGITDVSNITFPYSIRIRAFSRPYSIYNISGTTYTDASFNTQSVSNFIAYSKDLSYNTKLLFDISKNYIASYNDIKKDINNNSPIITQNIDLTGITFPSEIINTLHTRIVFVFSLYVDTNLPVYKLPSNKLFSVKILSYTLTPYQYYKFTGPDPTLPSSYLSTSSTNTIYDIGNPYTNNITPYYRIYNLTNGTEYGFKIASNNFFGTSSFSSLYTNICGSVPNEISGGNFAIESYNQDKKISIIWDKPSFSGYPIIKYRIEYDSYDAGNWTNIYDYEDRVETDLTFNTYKPIDISINRIPDDLYSLINNTSNLQTYRYLLKSYELNNSNAINNLFNGRKYYVRIAAYNQLGFGSYSKPISGVPISIPDFSDGLISFVGTPITSYKQINNNRVTYITFQWKVPTQDGGAPILDYIIEFSDVTSIYNSLTYETDIKNVTYQQYYVDTFQQEKCNDKVSLYKNIIVNKNVNINYTKNILEKYIIRPTPITKYEVDANDVNVINNHQDYLNTIINITDANKTYRYTSSILNENEFDLSNIQLKWYYLKDISNGASDWNSQIIYLKISMKGYILDICNNTTTQIFSFNNDISYSVANIINLVGGISNNTVSGTTNGTIENDNFAGYTKKYINYYTGLDISNAETPKIFVNQLTRINYKKKFILDISATNLTGTELYPHGTGKYPKINIRFAPMIFNGIMPVRTSSDLKTIISYTMASDANTPLKSGNRYSVRVRPFNIADVFYVEKKSTTPPYKNIESLNHFEQLFSADITEPISNIQYKLNKDGKGSIAFTWNYGSTTKYSIIILLTDSYKDYFPIEYLIDGNTNSCFALSNILQENGIVTFNIPDVNTVPNNYLGLGRSYILKIRALKTTINSDGAIVYVPSDERIIENIIPFTAPLRPIRVYALGKISKINLSVLIPNIQNDPNYYITDEIKNYYQYHSIVAEYSVENGNGGILEWNKLQVLVEASGNLFETWQSFDISGLINDTVKYNIRVGMQIYNNFNNQYEISNYTYPTLINNISNNDSIGSLIYSSAYPYKPSSIQYFVIYKVAASNNQIGMTWQTPSYNGNADYYKYDIFYSTINSPNTWINVYDTTNGIANLNDGNNTAGPESSAIASTRINFNLTCKISIETKYNIRISATGYYSSTVNGGNTGLNPINPIAISNYSVASMSTL